MSHPGLMRTVLLTLAHLRPHLGIPGPAWEQSNPNLRSKMAPHLSTGVPQEGAVGRQGGQAGIGAVHQSVGVVAADRLVGVEAHMDHLAVVVAHMDHLAVAVAHMDHPAGDGEHPGVGGIQVKATGVAEVLLIPGMAEAFQESQYRTVRAGAFRKTALEGNGVIWSDTHTGRS